MTRIVSMLFPLVLLVGNVARAAELRVPGDFPDVVQAVSASIEGDTIVIGDGEYVGVLRIPHSLIIRGAGSGRTALTIDGALAEVLIAEGISDLDVSGVTFRHTGKPGDELVEMVTISGGSARFADCVFENGWGSTLNVNGGAQVVAERCVMRDCKGYGGFVEDENSKLQLIDCAMLANRSGAGVGDGAELTMERVKISGSTDNGLFLYRIGARLTAIDSEISGSGYNGLLVWEPAQLTLRGCTLADNAQAGCVLFGGPEARIEGCTISENKGPGLTVDTAGTQVFMKDTHCDDNAMQGATIQTGAMLQAEGCTFSNNGGAGLLGNHWDTTLELMRCAFTKNKGDGARIALRAEAVFADTRFEENGANGLYWRDALTKVDEAGSVFAGNASEGVTHEDGYREDVSLQVVPADIGFLFVSRNFERLELLAERIRREKLVNPDGNAVLAHFYDAIETGYWETKPDDDDEWGELHQAYRDAYPESPTPLIASAKAAIEHAWRVRGGGFASEVTQEQFEGFERLLGKAEEFLQQCESLDANDPELYAAWMTVGMGLDYTPEEMMELLAKGQAIDPAYGQLYWKLAYAFTPRWGGGIRLIESVADSALAALDEETGARTYGCIAGYMVGRIHAWHFQQGDFLDWEIIDRGLTAQAALFPENNRFPNQQAWLACMYGQQERAVELFHTLENDWNEGVWGDHATFRAWRNWARGKDDMPELPARGDVDDEVYQQYVAEEQYAFLLKIGVAIGGAILVAAIFTGFVLMILRWQDKQSKNAVS